MDGEELGGGGSVLAVEESSGGGRTERIERRWTGRSMGRGGASLGGGGSVPILQRSPGWNNGRARNLRAEATSQI